MHDERHGTHSPAGRRAFLATSVAGAATVGATALPGVSGAVAQAAPATPSPPKHKAVAVFANNVGYDVLGPKRAVIGTWGSPLSAHTFQVVDAATGTTVHTGRLSDAGEVGDWNTDHYPDVPDHYWVADFSSLRTIGAYELRVGDPGTGGGAQNGTYARALPLGASFTFRVEDYVLERYTLSDVVHYFKGSRDSGQFEKNDRTLPIAAGSSTRIDGHGGWYDAAGDYGIHFNNQVGTKYLVSTQIPLVAWVCLDAAQQLADREGPRLADAGVPGTDFTALETWLVDEGLFGADFLVRMRIPGGAFYSGVSQPGVEKDPTLRVLSPTPVGFRGGAGQCIGALARASSLPVSGDHSSADYLAAATEAYDYLADHNAALNSDGRENLIDEYDALLGAVELFRATKEARYRSDADRRADQICARLAAWRGYRDYWRVDADNRPFFVPANAGLPVVSLLQYAGIADAAAAARARKAVRRSLEFELSVTSERANPFGYARQLVQNAAGERYTGFFMPQDVGGPEHSFNKIWWQGENARIASLAAAARLAARTFRGQDKAFADRLESYARDQLNWILGVNPFAVCMLGGVGVNNPQYIYEESWRFQVQAGGIVNGVTGRQADGSGIMWDMGYDVRAEDSDWRWKEQWLPHSAWYLHAVSVGPARL